MNLQNQKMQTGKQQVSEDGCSKTSAHTGNGADKLQA
tara:strand:- start:1389 stop:1499 length:111 start_codon:yes stop_codon:yes gene_type:complete